MTSRQAFMLARCAMLALSLSIVWPLARADGSQDLGEKVPDAQTVKEGLFPEDDCKELEAAGYKCMGFKPAVRFALPATSFKLGSAELPDVLRRQLDVFASVLAGKRGTGQVIRIEGHADASGSADANLALSQRRADAVKQYLVDKGADPAMLEAVGMGSKEPKPGTDPYSPVNRRVEIGRLGP
jgi:OOP family OmpA-OmpF porin